MRLNIPQELVASIGTPPPFLIGPGTKVNVCLSTDNHEFFMDLSYYLLAPDGSTLLTLQNGPLNYDPFNLCNPGKDVQDLCFDRDLTDTLDICGATAPLTGNFGINDNWSKIHGFNPAGGGWAIVLKDDLPTHPATFGVDGKIIHGKISFTDIATATGLLTTVTYEDSLDINIIENEFTSYRIPLGLRTSCFNTCDAAAIVNVSGGTPPYVDYAWSDPSLGNNSNVSLCAGNYTVTVTDALGCTSVATVEVTSPDTIQFDAITYTDSLACAGDLSTLQVVISGGTGVKEFSIDAGATWNPSGTMLTNISGGTYFIEVRDASGCTIDSTITIYEPAGMTFTAPDITEPLCYNDAGGSIGIGVNGGTAPYTYVLRQGVTDIETRVSNDTVLFLGLNGGTYTVTVTDNNACSRTSLPIVIAQPDSLSVDSVAYTGAVCAGELATIQIFASGGSKPLAYSIYGDVPGNYGADSIFSGLTPASFDIFIRDANGCVANYTANPLVIINPVPIVYDSAIVTDIAGCAGDPAGTIELVVHGGVGTLEYSIDDSATFVANGGTFTSLLAGTYIAFVRDSLGCVVFLDTLTVNEPLPVTIASIVPENISCNGQTDGSITVQGAGGNAPYRYILSRGGVDLDTLTGPADVVFTGLAETNGVRYFVRVTDAFNCTEVTSLGINILEPDVLQLDSLTFTDVACYEDSSLLNIAFIGGTSPFFYSVDGGPLTIITANMAIAPGSHTIHMEDSEGCSIPDSTITISRPPQITISYVTDRVLDCATDTTTLRLTGNGGVPPLEYSMDGTTFNSTGIFPGINALDTLVFVRDANSPIPCVRPFIIAIAAPPVLLIDSVITTPVTDVNSPNGTLTIYARGGTGTYLYSIDVAFGPSNTFTGLTSGFYTVTVIDENGCAASQVVEVPDLSIDMIITNTHPLCAGASDGTITARVINGVSPYTFAITGPVSVTINAVVPDSFVFENLLPGTYNVSVTDNVGKTTGQIIALTNPAALVFNTVIVTNVSGLGISDGTITITGSGGTGTLSYGINGTFGPGNSFAGLGAGQYTVSLRDQNGCQLDSLVVVEAPFISLTRPTCYGYSDGSITISNYAGTPPYTYAILGEGINRINTTNANTYTFDNLESGIYTISLFYEDTAISENVILEDNNTITIQGIAITLANCRQRYLPYDIGQATVVAAGGTLPYRYRWIDRDGNVDTTQTISGRLSGNYLLSVTDSFNCPSADSMVYIGYTDTVLTLVDTAVLVCVGTDTTLNTMVKDDFQYRWYDADGNTLSNNFSYSFSDIVDSVYYSVRVSNDSSCFDSTYFFVGPYPQLNPRLNADTSYFTDMSAPFYLVPRINIDYAYGTSYLWSPTYGLDDPTAFMPRFFPADEITEDTVAYIFTITYGKIVPKATPLPYI